jgi:predicted nucleic acid-binding protein
MKPVVVDTSVVFKWYRQTDDEGHVQQALTVLQDHLDGRIAVNAPDLLIYELGNLLGLKRQFVSEAPITILRRTLLLDLQIHPIDQLLAERALAAAERYGVTFYDAAFLALAGLLRCPFITADRKLYRSASSFPKIELLESR